MMFSHKVFTRSPQKEHIYYTGLISYAYEMRGSVSVIRHTFPPRFPEEGCVLSLFQRWVDELT